MTDLGPTMVAFFAAGAVAVGGLLTGGSGAPAASAPRTALVVDAAAGREGRDLVDARLRAAAADIRLPRTSTEAQTDVRYFAAQGYRVVVTGQRSTAAALAAGVPAVSAPDLPGALAAAEH